MVNKTFLIRNTFLAGNSICMAPLQQSDVIQSPKNGFVELGSLNDC